MGQDNQSEHPDLRAAMISAWPVLGQWQSRLANDRRVQAILRVIRNRAFQRALRAGIVGLFLAFVTLAVYKNWDELRQYDWQADVRYLLLAAVGFPLAYLPTVWCWHWLVRRVSRFADGQANMHIFCLSSLGRYVPGAVWYIAGRAYWYRDHGVPGSQIIISTLWENVIFVTSGLIAYILLGWQEIAIGSLVLILAVLLYPTILNRLVPLAQRKLGLAPPPPVRPLDVLSLFGALAVAWAAGGALLWLVTNAIYPLKADALPSLIAIWGLAGAVSVIAGFLVGGLGIRELTLGALLSQLIPAPVAIVVALAFRLVLTISEGIWALILSWLTRPKG